MSKYGPKKKTAFELAKEYGIFEKDMQETDTITNGELCKVFMYICDHFQWKSYSPSADSLLKDHPMGVAFQQCIKYRLILEPQNFLSRIDEKTTFSELYEMAKNYCMLEDIKYDAKQSINMLTSEDNMKDSSHNGKVAPLGAIAILIVNILKIYVQQVVGKIREYSSKKQYQNCTMVLLEHIKMSKLFPSAIQDQHVDLIFLLEHFPDVSEWRIKYIQYCIDIQNIFEKYFGYYNDGKHIFSDPIYHYTSLSTLEKVTGGSPLRLSNAINLNDPSEGKALIDLLNTKDYDYGLQQFGYDEELKDKLQNFYILSFNINEKDDIPMWQQYGAGCMGCRLAYRLEQFQQYPIYRVIYDRDIVNCFLEELEAYHKSNVTALGDIRWLLDGPTLNILNQASFLYKDHAYQYENEVRVIRCLEPSDAIEGDIREGEYFPRLYTELPADMKLDSVLLGPKVSDYLMDHIRLGIQARGMCCGNGRNINETVTRSTIKIR